MNIQCAIIDDEFLARQYIREYIQKIPFLELAGDFNSPLKAYDLLSKNKIDLLFLDIEMPDISGIEFLKSLDNPPFVILTTAYREYALEGYELNVSDYLLKPFSFDRFVKAVNKVMNQMQAHEPQNAEPDHVSETRLLDSCIIVRADRKHYKINYDDLIYIEGQKAYVSFYTDDKRVTALATMKDLEDNLPAGMFIRIHKSYIVSIQRIESLEGNMIDIHDSKLPVGKSYRKAVNQLFGLNQKE